MWWMSLALAVPVSAAPQRAIGPVTAFGQSSLAVGDLDGDGRAEVGLGVADVSVGGQLVGAVEIWRGGAALTPYLSAQGSASMLGLGQALAFGDVSCDGIPDVVVAASGGAPPWGEGAVLAWFGPLAPGVLDPATADLRLAGVDPWDGIGRALEVVPDLTGDGCDDLVVASPYVDSYGQLDAGAVYVVQGGPARAGRIGAAAWATVRGSAYYGQLGYSVSAGDVDLDGVDELLIGEIGTASGAVWVAPVAGLPRGADVDVAAIGAALSLPASPAAVGVSVDAADADGDGLVDLLVGAPAVGAGMSGFGAVCLGTLGGLPFAPGALIDLRSFAGCTLGSTRNGLLGSAVRFVDGLRGPGIVDAVVLDTVPTGGGTRSARANLWTLPGGLPAPGGGWAPGGPSIDPVAGVASLLLVSEAGGDVDGDGRADLAIATFSGGRVWVTVW